MAKTKLQRCKNVYNKKKLKYPLSSSLTTKQWILELLSSFLSKSAENFHQFVHHIIDQPAGKNQQPRSSLAFYTYHQQTVIIVMGSEKIPLSHMVPQLFLLLTIL